MFHCSGWSYPWAVTAAGGTQVCLRKVEPKRIFDAIAEHRVTHMCGAPIVLNMLVARAGRGKRVPCQCARGRDRRRGAARRRHPSAWRRWASRCCISTAPTETYGPATICAPSPSGTRCPTSERYALMARQGIAYPMIERPDGRRSRHADEPCRGTARPWARSWCAATRVMKGYLKNRRRRDEAFAGGWFHSGDLAVWHRGRQHRGQGPLQGHHHFRRREHLARGRGGPDASGGHGAAVVARPDEKWGETPCAFVTLKPGAGGTEAEHHCFLPRNWRASRCPKTVVFGPLPKTSTGKIQKFVLRDRAKTV